MAIYHFNIHSNRCGSGANAIAHAAYVSASRIQSERTGEISDYSKKGEVVHSELLFPDGVQPVSREELWNSVEATITTEGHNYGKTGDFALPVEWTDEQCIEIARRFLNENFVSRGHAVDFAFHKKEGNPHIDYFVPSLKFDEDGKLVPPKIKSVFANAIDENGKYFYDPELPSYDRNDPSTHQYRFPVIDESTGEQAFRIRKGGKELKWHRVNIEDDSLSSRDFLLQLRQSWQDIANQNLDEEHQIDCRSLEAQGIEREPQIHLSPAVMAMEKKNPGSMEKVRRNNLIKERNMIYVLEQEYMALQAKIQGLYNNAITSVKERFKKLSQSLTEPNTEPSKSVKAWSPSTGNKAPEKPWFLKDKKNIPIQQDPDEIEK